MTDLTMPALRGDSPLGFLAAVGTLVLTRRVLGHQQTRLSWPDGPFNGAVLSGSDHRTTQELGEDLAAIADELRENRRLVPRVDGFPIAEGSGGDPMSTLTIGAGRNLAEAASDDSALGEWITAIVGLTPTIDRKTGEAKPLPVSRFFRVGPGTVWVGRTLASTLKQVSVLTLIQALDAWRRVDFVGGYLDHQADLDSATLQNKKTFKRGVPGATWLALMATPLFPVRTSGLFHAETVGWTERRGLPKGFHWPTWTAALGIESIAALVDHPVLAEAAQQTPDEHNRRTASQLHDLGLSALFRSVRLGAGNYDAALGPSQLVWISS